MTFMRAPHSTHSLRAPVGVHPTKPPQTTSQPAQLITKESAFIRNLLKSCRSLSNRQSVPKVQHLSSYSVQISVETSPILPCLTAYYTSLLRDSFIPQKILSNRVNVESVYKSPSTKIRL